MAFEVTARSSVRTWARATGGLYVLYMAASVLADALAHIGMGDEEQVYLAITTNPSSFRLGLLVAFASGLLFLLTAWGLYVLLRRLNGELSLLFLLLNAVGVAVQCASLLALVAALHAADPAAGGLNGFTDAQAAALSHLAIGVYKTGFVAAQLFFGAWLFPLGYLVYRSGMLPRVLGVLLIADGCAEMIWLVQAIVLPTHPEIRVPGTFVSLLAEVGLALWLLIRAVRIVDSGPDAPQVVAPSTQDG
ncbi:DUF4386 domain-containing protein [Demequina sp.]|uniref:DUF4386 domain-containing protein n=1 Tax=Demequina sp. TaxID=2050685 RepID=UPI0025DAC68E|nr:DUF4386 domain-containing protein [Demequina sp.]